MFFRAVIFAAALIAAPASAATFYEFDLDNYDPAKPMFFFVIDTPRAEVWSTMESADGGAYNIFPDPMTKETMGNPEGDNILGLEELWEVDLTTIYFSSETPFKMRFVWSDRWLSWEDFGPVVAAPIPAALPMLLAALAGLGLLGARRRRA